MFRKVCGPQTANNKMFNYNLNSGYGQISGQWPFLGTGKVFVVGASAMATRARNAIEGIMKVDPDGEVRFHETIDAAVSACVNDRNDVVYVLPGHTEAISGTSAINLDVRGMSVIGLGHGQMRPVITLDGMATTSIAVSADDVTVENITFRAGYADVATCFEVGSAKQFTVRNCDFIDDADGENFLVAVRTFAGASAADGLTVENCTFITPDAASLYFVHIRGGIERLTIKDNYVNMGVNTNDYPVIKFATGKEVKNFRCTGNHVIRKNDANDLFIDNDQADNSGIIANNYMLHNDDTSNPPIMIDCDGCGCFENYETPDVTGSGSLSPAVYTTRAV